MSRDDILELARYAGLLLPPQNGVDWSAPLPTRDYPHRLERFAAIVAAAERNACTKIAEDHQNDCYDGDIDWHEARRITAAIRARGEE